MSNEAKTPAIVKQLNAVKAQAMADGCPAMASIAASESHRIMLI